MICVQASFWVFPFSTREDIANYYVVGFESLCLQVKYWRKFLYIIQSKSTNKLTGMIALYIGMVRKGCWAMISLSPKLMTSQLIGILL